MSSQQATVQKSQNSPPALTPSAILCSEDNKAMVKYILR